MKKRFNKKVILVLVSLTVIVCNLFAYDIIKETAKYTKIRCSNGIEKLIWPSSEGDSWCVKNFGWTWGAFPKYRSYAA
jgi:hypothetical protein